MVISAIPNASAIPTMPNCPPPNTAAPSPVSTSTNVPNISAAYFIAILLGFNLDPSTENDYVAHMAVATRGHSTCRFSFCHHFYPCENRCANRIPASYRRPCSYRGREERSAWHQRHLLRISSLFV